MCLLATRILSDRFFNWKPILLPKNLALLLLIYVYWKAIKQSRTSRPEVSKGVLFTWPFFECFSQGLLLECDPNWCCRTMSRVHTIWCPRTTSRRPSWERPFSPSPIFLFTVDTKANNCWGWIADLTSCTHIPICIWKHNCAIMYIQCYS